MLMKFLIIVTTLFLFSLSVSAGTFLETFDGKELDRWQQIWRDKAPLSGRLLMANCTQTVVRRIRTC